MPFLIAGIIILVILLFTLFVYMMIFFTRYKHIGDIYNIPNVPQYNVHKDKMISLIEKFSKVPYEQVYVKAFDGKTLSGRFYKFTSLDAPIDICFHGYKGSAARDFCGGGLIPSQTSHNMIVVEQRGHGKSDGCTLSFGINEKKDCLAWIYYVIDRFGKNTKIMLYGVSMGASTVLFASGLSLPENVKGIIADSPYSSASKIIRKVCEKDMKIPWFLVGPFVYLAAFIYGHFRLSEGNVLEYTKKAKVPILIIHGDDDRFVPCEMSEEIMKTNPNFIQRETFKDAGHAISYIEDPERYVKTVINFINSLNL